MTIKGITPLTALAFLSDIGDISRFKNLRKMDAYLGLVPKSKDSGGKSKPGHINRESRKLIRTILTQPFLIYQTRLRTSVTITVILRRKEEPAERELR
jgi:transposase